LGVCKEKVDKVELNLRSACNFLTILFTDNKTKCMNRIYFIFLVLLLASCKREITETFEWRGTNRTGSYNESNLLKAWPENGPSLLWETNQLGTGYGSPTVTNDKIFITGTQDSTAIFFAFDLSGKLLFKEILGQEWIVNYPGSRCTPTVVGNRVYVLTGKSDLVCLDSNSGKVKWRKNLVADFGGVTPLFGFSESLLIDGNNLICTPGGVKNNVVALNRFTGELVWSCPGKGERSAYNSPAIITAGNRKIVAAFSAYHLLGIDAATGELLWAHEQINTPLESRKPGYGDTHSNTILFEGNMLYYVEGDGNCAVALALSEDGRSITQQWNNAIVDNYMGGIVKQGNYLYSCGFSKKNLVKVDANTGIVVDSLSIGRGSLIMADNMLYYYNFQGEIHLIDFKGGSLKDVSSFKVDKGSHEHFSHPVIKNGTLYVRHGEYLGAYNISE
jgi:outer membrane protein assembly factor BamB